jgi:hypothetical protein
MNITDEQIDAIFGDSPFIARRTIDKRQYEVIEALNDDWREVITNDEPRHHGFFRSYDEAETVRRQMHVRWVLRGCVAGA